MKAGTKYRGEFGLLPFCKETDLESFLLHPVPRSGSESFLAGRVVVNHAHGSKGCAKALVDLTPKVFGRDEPCLASVNVAGSPLKFLAPFGS